MEMGGVQSLPDTSLVAPIISTYLCPANLLSKRNSSKKDNTESYYYTSGIVIRDLLTLHHYFRELSPQLRLRDGE